MIIRVHTEVYMEIGGDDPEEICATFDSGLTGVLEAFPHAEIIQARVDHFEKLSSQEIKERGFDE